MPGDPRNNVGRKLQRHHAGVVHRRDADAGQWRRRSRRASLPLVPDSATARPTAGDAATAKIERQLR